MSFKASSYWRPSNLVNSSHGYVRMQARSLVRALPFQKKRFQSSSSQQKFSRITQTEMRVGEGWVSPKKHVDKILASSVGTTSVSIRAGLNIKMIQFILNREKMGARLVRGLEPSSMLVIPQVKVVIDDLAKAMVEPGQTADELLKEVEKFASDQHKGGVWKYSKVLERGQDNYLRLWLVLAHAMVDGRSFSGDMSEEQFLSDTTRIILNLNRALKSPVDAANLAKRELILNAKKQFDADTMGVPVGDDFSSFIAMAVAGFKSGVVKTNSGEVFAGSSELDWAHLEKKLGYTKISRADRGREATFYVDKKGVEIVKVINNGLALILNGDMILAADMAALARPTVFQPSLGREGLSRLFSKSNELVKLTKGQVLFEANQYADEMFRVEQGKLRVIISDTEQPIIGEKGIVGEMGVIGASHLRLATVVAETDEVILKKVKAKEYWREVSLSTAQHVQELASARKGQYPKFDINGSEVYFLNVEKQYQPAVEGILKNENLRQKIFASAGVPPSERGFFNSIDIQFAGQGSIKHVLHVSIDVGGKIYTMGLRLFMDTNFRYGNKYEVAKRSANEEIAEFKSFADAEPNPDLRAQNKSSVAIRIDEYISAHDLDDGLQQLLSFAGLTGFTIGEFIEVPFAGPNDTGISRKHLVSFTETLIKAWFIKQGRDGQPHYKGPSMGDLKLPNLVLNIHGSGNDVKIVDLGDVLWMNFDSLVTQVRDLIVRAEPILDEAAVDTIMADGISEAVRGQFNDYNGTISADQWQQLSDRFYQAVSLLQHGNSNSIQISSRAIARIWKQ